MTELKCRGCGLIDPDVYMHSIYIGGKGNVNYPYCVDMVMCTVRQNEQMGLPKDFNLEKASAK